MEWPLATVTMMMKTTIRSMARRCCSSSRLMMPKLAQSVAEIATIP